MGKKKRNEGEKMEEQGVPVIGISRHRMGMDGKGGDYAGGDARMHVAVQILHQSPVLRARKGVEKVYA